MPKFKQHLRILTQDMSPCPVKPRTHVHVIVRRGSVEKTLHSALLTQGLKAVQGFRHSPLLALMMQASLPGHSLSSLQPRSTTGFGSVSQDTKNHTIIFNYSRQLWDYQNLLGLQPRKYGSPMWFGRQVQIPLWLRGVHSAFCAHWHGSTHFSLRHAKVVGHSGSDKHSYLSHLW